LNYLGFGAGAHSHYLQRRWENYNKIPEYIDSAIQIRKNNDLISPMTSNLTNLSKNDEISETMMMGLRLTNEGIHAELFQKRFGMSLEALYSKEIHKLVEQNLIEMVLIDGSNHLRLTKYGRLLGNQVFMRFLLD
jgi:oxygen-independent coproporphyrinogen III oxidase